MIKMENKNSSWTFDKLQIVVSHLADQQRFNCAFSGQNREAAYRTDLAFYNSDLAFANLPVTRRHLHGKDGIYSKIYGHAEALRSQTQQFVSEWADQSILVLMVDRNYIVCLHNQLCEWDDE